ncbi:hypothetical protein CHUAL_003673 [Chamberlinius hualienensis]
MCTKKKLLFAMIHPLDKRIMEDQESKIEEGLNQLETKMADIGVEESGNQLETKMADVGVEEDGNQLETKIADVGVEEGENQLETKIADVGVEESGNQLETKMAEGTIEEGLNQVETKMTEGLDQLETKMTEGLDQLEAKMTESKIEEEPNQLETKMAESKIEEEPNQLEKKIEGLDQLDAKKTEESTGTLTDLNHLEMCDKQHPRQLMDNVEKILSRLDEISGLVSSRNEQNVYFIEEGNAASDKEEQQTKHLAYPCQLEKMFSTQLSNFKDLLLAEIQDGTSLLRCDTDTIRVQIREIKAENELISRKIEELRSDLENIRTDPSQDGYYWVIKDVNNKFSSDNMNEWSPAFKIHGYKFYAQAVMKSTGNEVFLYLTFKDAGHFRSLTKMNFLPTLTVAICEIETHDSNKDIVRVCDPKFGYGAYQYNTSYYKLLLGQKNDLVLPMYVSNDSITVRIKIASPEEIEKPFSTNGSLNWVVDDYQNRRKMEEEGKVSCQQSPYFYTSEKGYRVKLELELRNGGLKARVYFVNGEFDRLLSSEFSHVTTLTLVDQTSNWLGKSDKIISVTKINIQDQCDELSFSLKNDLEDFKDSYVKNDSIIIKAEVHAVTAPLIKT